MILVKILKINWGLDFLWSKIYDKGMVKERQGKCVMILYHNPLCVLACTGTQNRIKEQSMYYIGIDLGTSAVKLLLMEGNGKIVRVASREYPLYFPHPGWSQQNPQDWYEQSMDGLYELLDGIDKSQVAGISFGGQMHGLVVLDENDQVIRPAILWNDGRTFRENDYLNQVIGKEKLSEYTANISFTGFTAPKILWMKNNEPENFARIKKIMLPKDYINYKLTGVHCTDYSDASGMLLLDVQHKCWSKEMLTLCGVTEAQLPKLFESWQPVGTLTAEVAAKLGLPADVVVCAGAGDNAAAAVGCGAVGGGKCNISLGTSGTVFITSDTFGVDKQNALHSFAHADGGYHLMGCILSAASCNKWWNEKVLHTTDYAAEQTPITADRLGTNDVYFLPYLMGERSPHNDPAARGAFVGLRMDTPRAALTRAVLEGVAFAIRDCVEIARAQGVKIKASTLCGGGAKSPLWREILANVLGIPLTLPQTEQGPGYGGAMLAAVACGAYPSVQTCAEVLVHAKSTTMPDPALVEKYHARYAVWHKLYPALKASFAEMEALQ